MEYIEEFDKLKTKVLKYILFKKRTEYEIKQKFKQFEGSILDEVIEHLKQTGYIDDENYIQRAVNEYINLKNMSIKEIEYKLMSKGIEKSTIENYIYSNKEMLLKYEVQSAINIINKKIYSLEKGEILNYLKKKGYMENSLNIALQEIEE